MKQELEKCSNLIEYEIDDGQVRGLFGNIDELYKVHSQFLDLLQESLPDNNVRDPRNKIGHCFVKMVNMKFIYNKGVKADQAVHVQNSVFHSSFKYLPDIGGTVGWPVGY